MNAKSAALAVTAISLALTLSAQQRSQTALRDGWEFRREASPAWEKVSIPHDWAITGPFDRSNDLQIVAITQNGETLPSEKTARSGGLPWAGKGHYRRTIDIPPGKHAVLLFDGAMSRARVSLNGQELAYWPYGYNSFQVDLSPAARAGENLLEVDLDNLEQSSRWYPGAGLYRNVHLILTGETYIPVWGTFITTPSIEEGQATVSVETRVCGPLEGVTVCTGIYDASGNLVASGGETPAGECVLQEIILPFPQLWSPEEPNLYRAETVLKKDGVTIDSYPTCFGVRSVSITAGGGFQLNGKRRQIQGVCLHHDLGPLGAAVNKSAIRHQLALLKDMGCDAIRTSHNMPAPELVELCNEMGFMMMIEPFDEWDVAKCDNGYHLYFDEWAEKDMTNMLLHYRNDPCVVMWSIGNEVPSQSAPGGIATATFLQDICHRLDPTRMVTCGMDQVWSVNRNGFAAAIDVPGYNYRTFMFLEGYRMLPQGFILGSETASTVSSRGVYHFPAEKTFSKVTEDLQSSSYDRDAAVWSNIPDIDFALADDYPWYLGQFVWTGFDYLGEPHPYDTDAWPSHSSYFGIIDLASLPKDRFYLYRSVWNRQSPTLHIVPHWTWPGREGQVTPVYVYTSYPSAELFINGVSRGKRSKLTDCPPTKGLQDEDVEARYRLMWTDVVYEPGELTVVAYDSDGNEAARQTARTAGKPARLAVCSADPSCPSTKDGLPHKPDAGAQQGASTAGATLEYLTVYVTDADGNPVPGADMLVKVKVRGKGWRFKAVANGDPTCLEPFQQPRMHLFSGKLTVITESTGKGGNGTVILKSKGLKRARIRLQ